MFNIHAILAGGILSAVGALSSAAQADDCRLTQIASLDTQRDTAGGTVVPSLIEGHEALLLIDTAGIYNLITPAAVDAMGITHTALSPGLVLSTMAGQRLHNAAVVHSLKLGNMNGTNVPFIVMPPGLVPTDVAGTLAPELIANYDVEIDPAHNKLNLFSPDHCPGKVVYWTHAPVAAVPMRLDSYLHIIVPATLDGQRFEATIDTGSSTSVLIDDLVSDKLKLDRPAAAGQAGTDQTDSRNISFGSLAFGDIAVSNPQLHILKDRDLAAEKTPMIIGMNVLRHLHTYIAYKEHMLYLSAADAPASDSAANSSK
jgi:predicted aspartyl protease